MAEYKEILSDLKRRKASLKGQLAQIEAAISAIQEIYGSAGPGLFDLHPGTVPYRGMTATDAAARCIKLNHRPMTLSTAMVPVFRVMA